MDWRVGQEWWAILILVGQAFLQSGKSRVSSFCLSGKIREKDRFAKIHK
jgi:hypothetical protein